MDKQIENAIEEIDKILEGLRLLTDAIKNDVKLLEFSLEELNGVLYPEEESGPTSAYVNQDPDLKH
tara:strand:+ start:157 stop:354 length:198 start_codon:yes stop_codon:yes gene_type:complete